MNPDVRIILALSMAVYGIIGLVTASNESEKHYKQLGIKTPLGLQITCVIFWPVVVFYNKVFDKENGDGQST